MQATTNDISFIREKPLLSKKEFALLTGLSIPTITRLCLAGDIPCKKIGASVRIPSSFLTV